MPPPRPADDVKAGALTDRGPRRPLLPVLRSNKAFGDTSSIEGVRDFYTLTHRAHNPHESEFHMQARLGFRRPKQPNIRLRPLEVTIADTLAARSKLRKPKGSQLAPPTNVSPLRLPEVTLQRTLTPRNLTPRSFVLSPRNLTPMSCVADSRPMTAWSPEWEGAAWTDSLANETVGMAMGEAFGCPATRSASPSARSVASGHRSNTVRSRNSSRGRNAGRLRPGSGVRRC